MALCLIGLAHGVAGAHLSLSPLFDAHKVTPSLIFGALSLAVLSFLGFDAISTLTEEAKGGARAVGLATMLSLVVAAILFVAQTYLASLFVLGRTPSPRATRPRPPSSSSPRPSGASRCAGRCRSSACCSRGSRAR